MLPTIFGYFRQVRRLPQAGVVSDAELIDRFVTRRDEAAFELLVWRHGPMVLSVCQRLLHNIHDAEDAFQATFFTLARKAGSIGKRDSVGSWLHKVAYRISQRVRSAAAVRARREQPLAKTLVAGAADETMHALDWRELRPILDSEVSKLPEKYRSAFVLCYLQGKTNEEAAAELGCPKGTILSRLARARERLREGLIRRGLDFSAPLASLLKENAGPLASLSPILVTGTVQASMLYALGKGLAGLVSPWVLRLTEETLRELATSKVRYVAGVLVLLAALGSGAGVLASANHRSGRAATPPGPAAAEPIAVPCNHPPDGSH